MVRRFALLVGWTVAYCLSVSVAQLLPGQTLAPAPLVPYKLNVPVPTPVKVPNPIPVPVPNPIPHPVPVPHPVAHLVPGASVLVPYRVMVPKLVPNPVPNPIPNPVPNPVPVPVQVPVPGKVVPHYVRVAHYVRVPVYVPNPIPVPVPVRVRVPVPVPHKVPVMIPVGFPHPIAVPMQNPVPNPVPGPPVRVPVPQPVDFSVNQKKAMPALAGYVKTASPHILSISPQAVQPRSVRAGNNPKPFSNVSPRTANDATVNTQAVSQLASLEKRMQKLSSAAGHIQKQHSSLQRKGFSKLAAVPMAKTMVKFPRANATAAEVVTSTTKRLQNATRKHILECGELLDAEQALLHGVDCGDPRVTNKLANKSEAAHGVLNCANPHDAALAAANGIECGGKPSLDCGNAEDAKELLKHGVTCPQTLNANSSAASASSHPHRKRRHRVRSARFRARVLQHTIGTKHTTSVRSSAVRGMPNWSCVGLISLTTALLRHFHF